MIMTIWLRNSFATAFFFLLFCSILLGQTFAPGLICASKDFAGDVELVWDLPAPCDGGNISGYIIYATNVPALGFEPLDTIFNLTQTTYDHLNVGAATWYYFMQTLSDCPGPVLSSDTINTEIPVEPEIITVTVTEDGVLIIWDPSVSPETFAYLVELETPNGFVVIDTVFGRFNTQYLHITIPDASAGYLVRAIDACGFTSLISTNVHRTIALNGSLDICNRTISLDWSAYVGWNEITGHAVTINTNDGGYQLTESLSSGQFSFTLEGFEDLDSLCIYIESTGDQSGNVSHSNRFCVLADIVNPMRFINLYGVSYTETNEVEMSWQWDTRADISTYSLLSGETSGSLATQATYPAELPMSGLINSPAGILAPDGQQPAIQINTSDLCNIIEQSNFAKPTYLRVEALPELINRLNWEEPEIEFAQVDGYRIFKNAGSGYIMIAALPASTNIYEDAINPGDENMAQVRYYVEAQMRIQLSDYPLFPYSAQSNRVDVMQESRIIMPNAFAPESVNSIFKPLSVFPVNLAAYQMEIYDRYGQQIFVSNNPDTGWDGTYKGRPLPQGSYVVMVNYTQLNGRQEQYRGTLVLLR